MAAGAVMTTLNLFRHDDHTIAVEPGEVIFEAGSPPDCMFGVIEGAIDIVANGVVLETVGPGGVLGELALIDSSPRSATAIAQLHSRVTQIDQRRFTWLVAEHPTFALSVMKIMAARLRRASGTD
jgi:CRP/FNR family cyclic AMP-dependent transcriptional regulator